jgi:iron complex outermembrane receptor protein
LHGISVFSQDTIPRKDSAIIEFFPPEIPRIIKINDPVFILPQGPYGITTQKPDSIIQSHTAAQNVTDLLGQSGITFLKTYGGGSLATTSVRGASESQTPVLWNGLNLQSPTNGNVDLSLLPVILFDDVNIQNGGNSATNGSGAIGGVINLNNNWISPPDKTLLLKYYGLVGSFGELNNGLRIGFNKGKIYSDVRAYRQVAQNDFTFRNITLPGNPIDTLKNGDFLQQGISAQINFHCSNKSLISARCWYQQSNRGIAPSMNETNDSARQVDKFLRSMIDWKYFGNHFNIETKSAAFTEYLNYDLGYAQPVSITNALSVINEARIDFYLKSKWKISGGISDTWAQAEVTQNIPLKKQNRASVFGSVRYNLNEKLILIANFREEELNEKFVPPVGSLGCDWNIFKWATLKTAVAKNYRIPTFNDLYWNPGGNPNLKPEDSWNEEITGDFHFAFSQFKISYTVTAYNRNTNNWIQWTPGPAYWYPQNLLSVWSRGVEHQLKSVYEIGAWKFTLLGNYEYVRATNEKSNLQNDPSIGKQLMYLPADRWNAMIQINCLAYYVSFLNQFTDLRFTSTDHSSYLPSFSVAQLTIGTTCDWYKKSSEIPLFFSDIFFRVNNLFNEQYQAISYRAMPGRSYQIGISLDLSHQLTKKKNSIQQ